MKAFVLVIFIALYSVPIIRGYTPKKLNEDCHVSLNSYQNSMFNFVIPLYRVAATYNEHFILSLNTAWIMLAAIAEGGSEETKQQLFKILNIPEDICVREKIYSIVTRRTNLTSDIIMRYTRNLVVDEGLTINPEWYEFVSRNSMLDVVKAPIRSNTALTETQIRKIMGKDLLKLNLTGNSVMLDSIDYNASGATAFTGAVIERSPFYNQAGEEIGSVDLMKVNKIMKIGYIKNMNAKVLEIPIGTNNYYRIFLVKFLGKQNITKVIADMTNDIVIQLSDSLKTSNISGDIAIPRIEMEQQADMRKLLENLGVKSIWTNAKHTKFISSPPAFPTSFVQRITISINEKEVTDDSVEQIWTKRYSSESQPEKETDFIANQPFLWGILDVETQTPIICGAFTEPTYPKHK